MVNHAVASRTNMERMKQVYQQLAKYRGTSGGEDVKMACELGTKAQNLPEGIPNHLIQNIEGSYLARSKHIHASLQQMAQQNAPQDPYNSQYTMQMIPQHETSQQNPCNYEKVPMEDVESYVNQEECSRQQNSQYTRIILHRNIAYSVNDPMKPPSNEVLNYANDQNHEFQQISRFPENYQTLNYDEAMVQKMKQEESERREYEAQNSFRMNEEKASDIFLLATHQATNQDISNNPNICEENREN